MAEVALVMHQGLRQLLIAGSHGTLDPLLTGLQPGQDAVL
jgi:hypothetical protein